MICYIPLPKTHFKQICIEYNIPFRRTVRDYLLEVSDSSAEDTSDDESHLSIEDTTEVTGSYASESMTQTKKEKSKKASKSSSKKRKTAQKLVSNKRQKTYGQNPRVDKKSKNKITSRDLDKLYSSFFSNSKKKQTKNGYNCSETSHLNDRSLSSSRIPNDNKKCEQRAAQRIPNGHHKIRKDENRIIEFLGQQFRHSDLINDYCECQQNCELDELSMAFDLLVRLPEDQLPKDLKIAVKGKSAVQDLLSSEDDRSDLNLDECLPPIDAIYQQTIEEEGNHIDSYIVEFLRMTNGPLVNIPFANFNEPQVSTSCQSSSGQLLSVPLLSGVELPILDTNVITNVINNT